MAVLLSQVDSSKSLSTETDFSTACGANGDEIFFHLPSEQASRLNVMDLQILGTSASLVSPAIALEHSLAKRVIGIAVQAKPASSRDARIRDAFGIRSKNSSRCEIGSSK